MYLMSIKFPMLDIIKGGDLRPLYLLPLLPLLLLWALKKREARLTYLFFISFYIVIMSYIIIKFTI